MKIWGLALLLFLSSPSWSKEYTILKGQEYGLYSLFESVMALVQAYDQKVISGCQVNFIRGLYYEEKYGPNWWEYYFEPISLGEKDEIIERWNIPSWHIEYCNTREQNHALIKKYIRLKAPLQARINAFAGRHFSNRFVIGVHYRGTDKRGEAPRVPYEQVVTTVHDEINKLGDQSWIIFLATDEEAFLKHLLAEFPGKVAYNHQAKRSTDDQPVHWHRLSPFLAGEEAIIDCMLLSKAHLLIRTNSNLSYIASCYNPTIPVIHLNSAFWGRTVDFKQKCKDKKDNNTYPYNY